MVINFSAIKKQVSSWNFLPNYEGNEDSTLTKTVFIAADSYSLGGLLRNLLLHKLDFIWKLEDYFLLVTHKKGLHLVVTHVWSMLEKDRE